MLALDSGPLPTLHAKFQYGPLDMVSLAKEMVRQGTSSSLPSHAV